MAKMEKTITARQLFFLVIQTQIGVSVLKIPHKVNEIARGGSGISIIIAGLITQALILMMWLLLKKYPGKNLYQILLGMAGPIFGRILIVSYAAHFILLGANIMISATDIIHRWLLVSTPKWVLLALFSYLAYFLAREKLSVLARFDTLACLLFIPLVLFVGYGLNEAHIENMLPLLEQGYFKIFTGAKDVTLAIYGFEILLVVYPFIKADNKQILWSMTAANSFTTFFYLFVVEVCLLAFSHDQLKLMPEPVIYLMKSMNFYIFDRADIVFVPIWSITTICSLVSYVYSAALGFSDIFKKSNHHLFSALSVTISFAIAFVPVTPSAMEKLDKIAEYMAYVFIALIPLVLLLISLISLKKKEGR
ncbi:GerAB/ArcD/ProY family transporter [Paenibacillus lemnae]|uniref:GerAB/ArcD/ProY family transporter n=1 Tax=Paenibacillus lemnae TaxID=1330551 RepID=A0A848MEM5_PAELE|nr:GerAB/ArcD/ProY family transporter [Paenibacillus lemnae]NMO97844.1 GerAB/ArcD/ProY family transporter [Paenibacillus lemnae]